MKEVRQIRVMLALMLLMWIVCSILVGEYVYRGMSSGTWPKVDGFYVADGAAAYKLRYQYTINGKIYQGTRSSFKLTPKNSTATMQPGVPVTVYTHPRRAEITVLEPGTDALSVTLLSFAGLATLLSGWALRREFRSDASLPR